MAKTVCTEWMPQPQQHRSQRDEPAHAFEAVAAGAQQQLTLPCRRSMRRTPTYTPFAMVSRLTKLSTQMLASTMSVTASTSSPISVSATDRFGLGGGSTPSATNELRTPSKRRLRKSSSL